MADYNIGGMGDEEIVEVRAVMVGAGQVAAEAAKVTGSLEEVGVAADTVGRKMERSSRRTFLMGQAMFTLRRFIYQGTLALTAAGGAAAYFGLTFDSNMQQSIVALTHFLGSTGAAKTELAALYKLAAYTPFQFQDVTTAAKSFLSFGFSVKDTNHYLTIMADTMSGLGETGLNIQQFTNDIVKMAARGKLMGQDIRELVSLHIPALKILQEQLGLTASQIQNIGLAGIPATVAIPALFRGLEAEYGGLAAKQQKTLAGRLSTLKDLTQQMLGIAMKPLFTWLQDVALPVVNEIISSLQKGFGHGGFLGSLRELNRSNAPFWFKILYTTIVRTSETVGNLYNAFKPLIVLMVILAFGILYTLNTGMGLFNRHVTIGTVVLWLLVAAFVAHNAEMWIALWRGRLLLIQTALYVYAMDLWAAAIWLTNIAMGEGILAMMVQNVVMGIRTALVWAAVAATVAWSVATSVLNGEMALLDALMYANPIGLIILAVLALAVGFYLLWTRSKTFRDIIKSIGSTALTVLGYIARTIEYIVGKIEALADKIASIPGVHFALAAGSAVADFVGGDAPNPQGGRFASFVNPKDTTNTAVGGSGRPHITLHSQIHLDRKVVGEAVAHYNADKKARR